MDLVSPGKSLKILLSVEGGHFFDDPLVKYRKISAYRIIPKNQKDGYASASMAKKKFSLSRSRLRSIRDWGSYPRREAYAKARGRRTGMR